MKKSAKRCNKSTNKLYGKSKKRKPKKKSRTQSRSYQLRKMRGGNNSATINLTNQSANLDKLNKDYSSAIKYKFMELRKFTDTIKAKKNNYDGKQIVDLIYNLDKIKTLPESLASPSQQYDHGLVNSSTGEPEKPITAGVKGTHVYVLVNTSTKSIIEILGVVTNP